MKHMREREEAKRENWYTNHKIYVFLCLLQLLHSRTQPQVQVESATSGPFRVESGMDCKDGEVI